MVEEEEDARVEYAEKKNKPQTNKRSSVIKKKWKSSKLVNR
jgi:hypothetical protein